MSLDKNKVFDNFEKISILGVGSCGKVYLVKDKDTQLLYAMKVIENINSAKLKLKISTEYKILLNSQHPFISKIFCYFQYESQICMVMPYCAGGDFYHILCKQCFNCITEEQTIYYASCVLVALEYLHFNGIIYRDLKPENILLHADGHIILTDFDLSMCSTNKVKPHVFTKPYSHNQGVTSEPDIVMNDYVGSPFHIAPEIINCKPYTCVIDWWSFGILIYEMLYGHPPFRGENNKEIFKSINECHVIFPHKTPRGNCISHKVKNLIKKLLVHNPIKRLGYNGGASEIKDHPFFKHVDFQLIRNLKPPIIPKINICCNIN